MSAIRARGDRVRVESSNRQRTDDCGFSVLELMLSVMVMSILMGGFFGMLEMTQNFHQRESAEQEVRQGTRIPFRRLLAELQLAGYELGTVPEAIQVATPVALTFAGDIDAGSPDPPCLNEAGAMGVERVAYQLINGTLTRDVGCWNGEVFLDSGTTQTVLEEISTTNLFRYFATDGTELVPGKNGLTEVQRALVTTVRLRLHVRKPNHEQPTRATSLTDSLSPEMYARGGFAETSLSGEAVLRNVLLKR